MIAGHLGGIFRIGAWSLESCLRNLAFVMQGIRLMIRFTNRYLVFSIPSHIFISPSKQRQNMHDANRLPRFGSCRIVSIPYISSNPNSHGYHRCGA